MANYRFDLSIFGGDAEGDSPRVAADSLGRLLADISRDVLEVGESLGASAEVDSPEQLRESHRLYIAGAPTKGKSVDIPGEISDAGLPALRAYASGVEAMKSSTDQLSVDLPRGFTQPIIKRILQSYNTIEGSHSGFTISVPQTNGVAPVLAVFDRKLKTALEIKLAVLARVESSAPVLEVDRRIYGYSIQGIMYEMGDRCYADPNEGAIHIEVDAQGQKWLCELDKRIAPHNLSDLWRSEVVLTGTALKKGGKHKLVVERLRPLPAKDPILAIHDLVSAAGGSLKEPLQTVMDRIRERED